MICLKDGIQACYREICSEAYPRTSFSRLVRGISDTPNSGLTFLLERSINIYTLCLHPYAEVYTPRLRFQECIQPDPMVRVLLKA